MQENNISYLGLAISQEFIVFDIKLSNTAEYKFSLIVVYKLQVIIIIIIILYNVW